MFSSIKACLMAISWAGLSSAHLIMKSPVPFGVDSLTNSPLNNAAIGSATSDFPCKQRAGVYKITQMNNMPVGQAQTLSFDGSASHGGGTCQLAVSLDLEPAANSTWKLIQVYEGGCPTSGSSGSGSTDDYSFSIPANFPNGQATLAWTWYNRVGNREIYMNCAPITVTGGADDTDYYNTLPDMYIINLPTSDCASVESTNQAIPYPGQFILKGDTSDKVADATGPNCAASAAAQTNGVSGYQGPASGSNATVATTQATGPTAAPMPNNGLYTQPTSAAAITSAVQTTQAAYTQPTSLAATTPSVQTTRAPYTTTAAAESASAPATSPSGTTSLPLSLMITVPSNMAPTESEATVQPPVSYSAPSTVQTSPAQSSAVSTAPVHSAPMASLPSVHGNATALPSNPLITTGTTPAAATTLAGTMSSPHAVTAPVSTPTTTALSTLKSSTMVEEEPSSTSHGSSASTPTSTTASPSTCPQDGVLLCNGPTQFGLCDHGHVVWQAVAAGTTCSNGAITKRGLAGIKFGRKEQLGRWFVKAS